MGKNRTGNEKKAIFRIKKLRRANLKASLHHSFREQPTLNADASRRNLNHVWTGGKSSQEVLKNLEARLQALEAKPRTWTDKNGREYQEKQGRKIRSDACVAVEVLVTGSPEHLEKMGDAAVADYLKNSLKWINKKYGKENVISAGVHRDERNIHMWAYVVPVTVDGRLNASEVIGNKFQMADLHDEFSEFAQAYGLERGDRGNGSLHIPPQVLAVLTQREREEMVQNIEKEVQRQVAAVLEQNKVLQLLLKDPIKLKKHLKDLEDKQHGQEL